MKKVLFFMMALIFGVASPQPVKAVFIDFEDLTDMTTVTDQYAGLGVTFGWSTVITAGISLNEFEFPPYSGTNVAFDDGGPMTVDFSIPMASFSAYFVSGHGGLLP